MITRNSQIDYLKCFAIVSVILLHTLTVSQRDSIGGVFYILQAVPVFMILSGINSKSLEKYDSGSLIKFYKLNYLGKRISRIMISYSIIYIAEVVINIIRNNEMTIKIVIENFIKGGWGPGGYYIPLMLQLIIVLPILYILAKKNNKIMLFVVFIINITFELIAYSVSMPNSLYRLILLRYIFAVGLGIYIALNGTINKIVLYLGAIFSFIYIYAVHYLGFIPPTQPNWQSQNAPSFIWAFFIVLIGFKVFPKIPNNKFGLVLCEIGEASYHIFLIQMIYFFVIGPNNPRFLNAFVSSIINLIICILFGIIFYEVEKRGILKFRKTINIKSLELDKKH